MAKLDQELEQYRNLMQVPDKFEDGFRFSSLLGALFVGLIMVPGALYMELLAGMGIGPAAQWVTVILFIEVAKRANAKMSRAEIFILFYMAGAIIGQRVHGTPLYQQFLVRSEAAVSQGIAAQIPFWAAPTEESAYNVHSFFQLAWLPAIGLIALRMMISKLDTDVLAYGLFRRTNDYERLPFPLAPVGAQGLLALADDLEGVSETNQPWRWRVFSIGGAIGMVFGLVYLALPTLSSKFLGETITIFPIPFVDLTDYTNKYLPAAATGMCFNLAQFMIGMVFPFFAVLGSFVGGLLMIIANKFLYANKILTTWQPGNSTVETLFNNNVDFYFSFSIGLTLAVAIIGLSSIFRRRSVDTEDPKRTAVPEGRGDLPNMFILGVYLFSSTVIVLLCSYLVDWHRGVMIFLIFYAFLYKPMISYVTARLEGLAGQVIEIPFIREISFILSKYRGVEVWFLPISTANYGQMTVRYKEAELIGAKFTGIWKTDIVLFPIILVATIGFSSFIWSMGDVPSPAYPYAQEIWEFEAKNQCLMMTATSGEYSQFHKALEGGKVGVGFAFGMLVFGGLSILNVPMTLFYGMVKGLSGVMIHMIIPQFLGALMGRYYFQRKMGLIWRQYVPVLSAGFFCGSGLISMFCIGMVFLAGATSSFPF